MTNGRMLKLFEVALWLAFAGAAFYFTFDFDRGIEIYRFGAHGWPRVVIALIVIAALLQAFAVLRRPPAAVSDDGAEPGTTAENQGGGYKARVAATLLIPLVYAGLLENMGFYVLTPFFILAILLLAGERRWKVLLGVSLGIYAALVFFFGKLLYINLPVGNWHPFYDISNWLLVLIR